MSVYDTMPADSEPKPCGCGELDFCEACYAEDWHFTRETETFSSFAAKYMSDEMPDANTRAAEVLREAADLVTGPRLEKHGDAGNQFECHGRLLRGWLMTRIDYYDALDRISDSELGWIAMVTAKLSRVAAGGFNIDDYVDLAGYAGLGGALAEREHADAD